MNTHLSNMKPNQPILILSMKRSGSTLMRNIVDTQPEIFGPSMDIGALCEALYTTNYFCIAHASRELAEPDRRQASIERCRESIGGMIRNYLDVTGKTMWCDKSLDNLDRLDLLSGIFPEAKYVCLYRHCLDVVNSYLSMCKLGFFPEICPYVQQSPGNLVAALVKYWVDKTSTILAFAKEHPEQCFSLSYESLVRNPSSKIGEMFNFLGLQWEPSLLEKVFAGNKSGVAEGDVKFHFSKQVYTGSIGGGAKIPLDVIPGNLLEAMKELLRELGYGELEDFYAERGVTEEKPSHAENTRAGHTIDTIMDRFDAKLRENPTEARSVGGVCKFVVNGSDGGTWIIDLTTPPGRILTGNGEADCVISISSDTLVDVFAGKRSVVDAFQSGEIAALGSHALAVGFGKLLLA